MEASKVMSNYIRERFDAPRHALVMNFQWLRFSKLGFGHNPTQKISVGQLARLDIQANICFQ